MELDVYLRVIRRWIWLIVLLLVIAAGASYLLTRMQPPSYTAQVKLLVGPGVDDPNSNLSILNASTRAMQTYANLATTRNVLEPVIDELKLGMGVNALAGQITVTPDTNTSILTIAVRSANQKQAVDIANGVAKQLQLLHSNASDGQSASNDQVGAQIKVFEDQAARSQARLSQLQSDLQAASNAENTPAFTDQAKKVQALEAQVNAPTDPAIAKQMQDHQVRIQQLETTLRGTVNVEARRLTLDELAREDQTLQALIGQVNAQKRLVLDQLSQERSRLDSMRSAATNQQSQILSQMAIERTQLADAQRNLSTLYPALSNASINQITVVDPAANATPETGKATLIILVAALAGLVLGITAAFAFEYLDDRIRTPEQLAATGARVWGWIGRQKVLLPPDSSKRPLRLGADAKVQEAYRGLSMKLMSNGHSKIASLLIANFEPGDTAAEVASNLAITLARAGRRVALVDANLQESSLGKWFQAENKEGLVDWLTYGPHDLHLVPVEWAPGLSVMPSGVMDSNSSQMLIWPRMADLINRVENQTDILIVAGPPLTASADSLFLASHLGGVLAVAEKGKTKRSSAEAAIENLRSLGIEVLGLILTDGKKVYAKTPPPPESRRATPVRQRLLSSAPLPQPETRGKT